MIERTNKMWPSTGSFHNKTTCVRLDMGTKKSAILRQHLKKPTLNRYFEIGHLKWSGKFGQRAKMYPTRTNGYENDKATELFRQV